MAAKMRKVLMLHGYAQSGTVFSKRLGALRKACSKDIEFVFVDGPLQLSPADLAKTFGTSVEDLDAAETADSADPALAPRGWWEPGQMTDGLNKSLELLRDTLKNDHFVGVLGFSQGAALAAILAALLEKPQVHPPFLIDGQPPHPPLEFCISVSGFRPVDPLSDLILLPSYSTPTLHVLGKTDVVVVEERSQTLIALSANKRVEYHDGGHFVPSKANWRNFLRDYMRNPLATGFSPSSSSASSQPASGAATPISPP